MTSQGVLGNHIFYFAGLTVHFAKLRTKITIPGMDHGHHPTFPDLPPPQKKKKNGLQLEAPERQISPSHLISGADLIFGSGEVHQTLRSTIT